LLTVATAMERTETLHKLLEKDFKMVIKQTVTLSLLGLVALVVFYLAPHSSIEIPSVTEAVIPSDTATPINTPPPRKAKALATPIQVSSDDFFALWLDAISASENPEDLALASIHELKSDRAKAEQLLLTAYSQAPNNLLVNLQIMRSCLSDGKLSICSLPYFDTLFTLAPSNGYIHLVHAQNLYKNGDLDGALAALVAVSESAQIDSYYWSYLKVIDDSLIRLNVARTMTSMMHTFGYAAAIQDSIYDTFSNICSSSFRSDFSGWSEACHKGAENIALKGRTTMTQRLAEILVFRYSNMKPEELAVAKELRQIQYDERSDLLSERSRKLEKLLPAGSKEPISDELWSTHINLWRDEGEWAALAYWHDAMTLHLSENDASAQ